MGGKPLRMDRKDHSLVLHRNHSLVLAFRSHSLELLVHNRNRCCKHGIDHAIETTGQLGEHKLEHNRMQVQLRNRRLVQVLHMDRNNHYDGTSQRLPKKPQTKRQPKQKVWKQLDAS